MLVGVVVLQALLQSVVFSAVGLVVFVVALWVIRKVMPFDVHKEIEVDQNTALGIVMGAFIIGLAIIIAAAIQG